MRENRSELLVDPESLREAIVYEGNKIRCEDGCTLTDDTWTALDVYDFSGNDSVMSEESAVETIHNDLEAGYYCENCGETFLGEPETVNSDSDYILCKDCGGSYTHACEAGACCGATSGIEALRLEGVALITTENLNMQLVKNEHWANSCYCENMPSAYTCDHTYCLFCGERGSEGVVCTPEPVVMAQLANGMRASGKQTYIAWADRFVAFMQGLGYVIPDSQVKKNTTCDLCNDPTSCCAAHNVHKPGHDKYSCFLEVVA